MADRIGNGMPCDQADDLAGKGAKMTGALGRPARWAAVLVVPSAMIAGAFCMLVNPAHPDRDGVGAKK